MTPTRIKGGFPLNSRQLSRVEHHGMASSVTIERILEEVRHGLLAAIVPGRRMEPGETAAYMVGILRTLWRYLALQEAIISSAEEAMSSIFAAGEMREPTSPTTTRTLARNWWLMWLGWFSIEQLEHPGLEMVPNSALFEGALQSHSIVQPCFEPSFSAGYLMPLRARSSCPSQHE